ncbi:hypothetical protein C2S51_026990 [Perilla frutescens var. frutescens]|nr:hypothetical protein C2S51_026990 [Perilla frutescens var. frutescens]
MEGNCSGSSRWKSRPEDDFTDLLSSVDEIFDENLYKYQVKKIPESFANSDQYLGSYIFPLLEEMRAEVASALETVCNAPFAEVTYFKKSKHGKLLYDVGVGHWRNRISDRGKEPYRTLPGDFVLLSEIKPESASELQRSGSVYTFAFVKIIYEDDRGDNISSSGFKLKTAGSFEAGDQLGKSLYVIYLMNTTTHKRIWNALRMRRNMKIIGRVLTKNVLADQNCELCPLKCHHNEVEEKLGTNLLYKINESQREAILACISKTGCSHKSSVQLIWGPPGTGKTMTLSILLYILLRLNVRTLICAPTNIAITELASQVTALVRNSVKSESEKSFYPYPFGEMLIFGKNDRVKVGFDAQEIFLDYRVKKLMHCLVPLTGWKHCIASMLDFLEDCVSQHRIFVENELMKSKELLDGDNQQSRSKSFLEFARDQFTRVASHLKSCLLTIITHIPRSFIHEENYERIVQLLSLLDILKMLLFEVSCMKSVDLEDIFLQEVVIDSESVVDTTSLHYIRSQSLSILRSLQASLSQLGFPEGETLTTNFCFQKASLIFCTISSSYKLHSIDMKPFHVLVIDEAAQVKECETAIALQIPDVMHAILVGDEMQLPATVSSKLSEEAGFGRSLFERLSSMGHSKHLLNIQYRMHPSISRFPNLNFYFNQIKDAPNVQSESYEKCYLQGRMFGPYTFINFPGGREESDDVAVIVMLVQKLFKDWNGSKVKLSIGLISPYASQVAAIRDKLQSKYNNVERFTVKVNSIDGFQGGEEDIIIISTLRSSKDGSIGFLSNQRINVALTRARHCLWILGSERTLNRIGSVWGALISDAKDRRCFFNAAEDCDFRKATMYVKTQFKQLDDLLSGESILFKTSRWQVLFSDNFRKSFSKLKSNKKFVINFLLKLASGWRPKRKNVDWKCENSSYIVKQFNVDIYCVVCSIDIIRDSIYKQVLKVWDILPKMDTTKLLKRLDSIFSMYSDDFVNHCSDKLFEGNLEVPKSWSLSCDISRFKNPNTAKLTSGASASSAECRSYVENTKVSESLLLMKFYTLSTGAVCHLLSDIEGREVDLPFEVTDEEREIISFPRSSFILGRSGTGKTTILTMKLYQKFQQYCIASRDSVASDNGVHISNEVDVDQSHNQSRNTGLHQLFVTVSPKLCHAVNKHVSQLKRFATGKFSGSNNFSGMDDVDEMAEFKDIPDTFFGLQQEKYPLIITFHKFLMMIDGTLGQSYFQRFPDVKGSSHYEGRRSIALQAFMRKNEVTFDRFWSLYWPHFNLKLTKGLDASRVFTEIMSHIKGGVREGEAWDCKRSREDYVSLSECRISSLSMEERNVIYDIFEDYEKMKLERGDFDLADFVNDIHLRLKNEDLLGDKMDFVYIDEVQDLTLRQISLFRYICKNVDEGFVFSGDTAQTIAQGIDFRFEDIRSLFYNEFLMKSRDCDFPGRREKGLISDMFSLSQNFRTHTGVLKLVQSVVDLISYYFPQSIDSLAPETSLIYGESPVILEPGTDENMIISIFGHRGKDGGNWVGFGADQVILVRDDSARNEVLSYIGDQALVLTILECKGLEFQDVLLYNFFGSSPKSNQWRVVYEFLKQKDLLDNNSPKSFPSFSESRHNILCSELKQLYVAITRTRQRLWICENNVEVFKPMLDYWKRLGLVQERKLDDSLAKAMQRASGLEEWKSQGIKLFWEKNYEMAIMCFEKAGEEVWEKRAKASGLRAAAEILLGSNPDEASVMLREAAEIFDSIDRAESAVECFCDLGEYERAGLRKAGECFSLAGSYETAAEVYAKGNFLTECLSACIKGNYFDLGLQYIEFWKQQASSDSIIMARFKEINIIAHDFLQNCASKCYKANDKESLMKFVQAFPSMELKRNFLKSLDCYEELLVLEEESGHFDEAAKIAKSLGDILHEVDLLEKAEQFENVSMLILSYVLAKSLWVSGNRGWPLKSFPERMELLNRAMLAAQKVSGTFHASICAESKILLCQQRKLYELMQCYHDSVQYETPIGEVLSIRGLLDAHFQVNAPKYEWDRELYLDLRTFDERMSKSQVSGGTLFYLWNWWKAKSLDILECLDGLEKLDSFQVESTARFCFNYFGVRLSGDFGVTCHLMNPHAAWIGNVDKRFVRLNRNVATLEARHFASAARKFWQQELVSIGIRVLEALQKNYQSSTVKCLHKHVQSICLLYIFDIANFLLDSNPFEMKKAEASKLQDFVALSTEYFKIVFPLEPQQSLSEDVISLRETELSNNLLEEIVSRNISTTNSLAYGQIGQTAMILLGSGKLRRSLYERVGERLSENSSWKSLFENLKRSMEPVFLPITTSADGASHSAFLQESWLRCSAEALGRELHGSLLETYNVNLKASDCISPNCFIYLVERLLILAPRIHGTVFTTKSSFVEYLICRSSDANPRSSLVTDSKSYPTSMVQFVVSVIEQCISNSSETIEWIGKSSIDCNFYFPVLVLRLLIILCLLCMNWDLPFDRLYTGLYLKLALPMMRSRLLKNFCVALKPRRRSYIPNLCVSAMDGAFRLIGDPLVIVFSRENNFKITHPDAILLDLRSFSCKSEIMKSLFPRSTNQPMLVTPVVSSKGESLILQSSEIASKTASNWSLEKGKESLQIKSGLIRELSGAFESLRNRDSGNLKSLLLRKKVILSLFRAQTFLADMAHKADTLATFQAEVEKYMSLLTTAVVQLTDQRSHSGEDKNFSPDATRIIEEVNALSSLFRTSDFDSEALSKMRELLKSLAARQPQLDALLSQLKVQNDPNATVVFEEKIYDSNGDRDNIKTEDSTAATSNPRNQGKGKKKKKNKKGRRR